MFAPNPQCFHVYRQSGIVFSLLAHHSSFWFLFFLYQVQHHSWMFTQ